MKRDIKLINSKDRLNNPVVIGGIGGSGTRLVAEILEQIGFYIGQDLNVEKDNLWFSLLFKRPEWFIKNKDGDYNKIIKSMDIFLESMVGSCKLDIYNFRIFSEIIRKDLFGKYKGEGHRKWAVKRMYSMLFSKKIDISEYKGWGWKEPNTHIYMKYLASYFNNLKYIHVVRNGLDMAYSGNKNQLINWGGMFNVEFPQNQDDIPRALLDYWIKSNNKAIDDGRNILKNNFYLIRFDELCINPKTEINNLLDFLNINRSDIDLEKLYNLPRIPRSFERYKSYDLSVFSKEQINAVSEMGFNLRI